MGTSMFKKGIPFIEKKWFYYLKFNNKYEFIPKNWYGRNGFDKIFFKNSISFKTKPDKLTKLLSVSYCVVFVLFMHIVYLAYLIRYPFYVYKDGCKNFINNGAWANNVREFNWINFIGFIITSIISIILLIKK